MLSPTKEINVSQSDAEQINGREGETATLYERRSLNPKLRGSGFAPRHLNRSASPLSYNDLRFDSVIITLWNLNGTLKKQKQI